MSAKKGERKRERGVSRHCTRASEPHAPADLPQPPHPHPPPRHCRGPRGATGLPGTGLPFPPGPSVFGLRSVGGETTLTKEPFPFSLKTAK